MLQMDFMSNNPQEIELFPATVLGFEFIAAIATSIASSLLVLDIISPPLAGGYSGSQINLIQNYKIKQEIK